MAFDKDVFIKQIEEMTALELAELVESLEEKFGVSVADPVAMSKQDDYIIILSPDNEYAIPNFVKDGSIWENFILYLKQLFCKHKFIKEL